MSPDELLHLIVEASLGLAGFAGVVNALARRGASELPKLHLLHLVNLLATSFCALFLSLIALLLLSAGVEDHSTWRFVSVGGVIVSLYFAYYSFRTIAESLGVVSARRSGVVLGINGPLVIVCAVQVWNIATRADFWPFFMMLVGLFAIGCYSFARLLFVSSE